MSRRSTILPPPSDFPVPMPEPAAEVPESGYWRQLVELTKETVRPGPPLADLGIERAVTER
jgi:hypothetical protein